MEYSLRPKGCHILAKPTGSVCNLDCSYCFYLEKDKLYPDRQKNWRMNDDTLEIYVQQYIEAQAVDGVEFAWQGGEPTLMGIDFFERALHFQKRYANGKNIRNTLQTNGIKLDDKWCEFLAKHDFLVGISIDGPADIHDAYRLTRSGKGTHQQVMDAIQCMKKHGVEFNTLTVINDKVAANPKRVYEFLKTTGTKFFQFIPLVERRACEATPEGLYLVNPEYSHEANVTSWSVPPKQYGIFLSEVFDLWVKRDVGTIFVQMFDATLAAWYGEAPTLCVTSENCGHSLAIESNGDLYNCDHYVYPEHKLGNIHNTTIDAMNTSSKAIDFGTQKSIDISVDCKLCEFRFACHGGCPKHRFLTASDGRNNRNYLCEGYKIFFERTGQAMKEMVRLLHSNRPPSDIMGPVTQQVRRHANIGRNSPCPCGSGKKYKRCCGPLQNSPHEH
ncbi:anaerobic sulfatase maturase [Echinimonas agarilytica]|uniref:Anaerobic sulfatase maturase n=1 Tax=Echinimonas agarilytica TaxID=1215918 RepID=A0AA41W4J7_9GAMM|nr:anaerobic sulfatase maturase [Echinimonas agarilytica]MCM2678650.1 anaerobic sulfatase maturase [Echinimonas agarilytica]